MVRTNAMARRMMLAALLPVLALMLGAGVGLAQPGSNSATVILEGAATLDPDPDLFGFNIVIAPDPETIGCLLYTYEGAGEVRGQLRGSFEYVEEGRMCLPLDMNPEEIGLDDIDSELIKAEYTLLAGHGRHIQQLTFQDTSPELHTFAHAVSHPRDLPGWAVGFLMPASEKPARGGPSIFHSWYTFTNELGTFTGYATPLFDEFIIQLEIPYDRTAR